MAEAIVVLASDYVGAGVLEFLAERKEHVSHVVLDPSDRGQFNVRLRALAAACGAEVMDGAELRDPQRLEALGVANPRLGILAWWPHIVKKPLIGLPQMGWLNFHPGLLPFNRGKYPNFWCLVDGTPCGVSLHFIDDGVDTGDVVAQRALEVSWLDTGQTIYLRCREAMVQLFRDSFDDLMAGRLVRRPQDLSAGTAHRAADIEAASALDLDRLYSARHLLNVIRARSFPPHPSATFRDGGKTYSVEILIREVREAPHE